MADVELDRITKVFTPTGGVRQRPPAALEEMTLKVRDRECVVLVGPSGSGKSTALRIVAGLEQATGGEVYIGGRRVTHLQPRERNVSMVFQSYALYPHLDVEDNLGFGLRLGGQAPRRIHGLVTDVANSLGIDRLLRRKPRQLSGGQRQRVALGRAIVRRPDVFLMDEPLSNLDAKLRVQTRVELQRLHREIGSTVIYVTHDQTEAMTLGDRIVVLRDGSVQQIATPVEIYSRPSNVFVARFIGSPAMNVLPVEVAGHAGGLTLEAPGVKMPVAAPRARGARLKAGQRVLLGVRPEHLKPAALGERLGWPVLEGRVEVVEDLGSETLVHLRVGDELVTGRFGGPQPVADGDEFRVAFDPADAHLFDEESGSNREEAAAPSTDAQGAVAASAG